MSRTLSILLLSVAALLPWVGAGCSTLQAWKQSAEAEDVSKIRQQRRKDAQGDFERRRTRAQLLAAQEHAERGDPESAEQMLLGLIERDPTQVDARAQLAELYWAHDQWPEAERQLREALKHAPERADLHHSLGLVLDAADNSSAAQEHLAKAVELEPANPLYRLAAESIGPSQHRQSPGSGGQFVQPAQSLLPAPPSPGSSSSSSKRR
jgi:Tfp pilus assembly protein PilF